MTTPTVRHRVLHRVRTVSVLAVFALAVIALMLWLIGAFKPKIGAEHAARDERPVGDARVVEVVARTLPLEETAVGAIQPVHRVELASRILSRAIEVDVVAGQQVQEGEVLVRLDSTDLEARRDQAESAVAETQAALDQTRIEESRLSGGFEQGAVSQIELDRAVSARKRAEANLSRSQQALTEAETVLDYATIRSPIAGTVVDKRVNAGDTVSPGQTVVTLLDPERMQLVASVRESLSRSLEVGMDVTVRIDGIDHACSGTVSEIVPEAQTTSRTFEVKVTGPCPSGVYAGMFGRLFIPVGEETVILVPRGAIRTVGQLELVDIADNGVRRRRAVRTGRAFDGEVEVLSGLRAGERVVVESNGDGGRGS